MNGLEINKFAAAFLLACLIASVAGLITEGLYHEGESEKRGYSVATNEAPAAGGAPAAEEKPVDIAPYLAKADLTLGSQLISRCTVCHTFEKGQPNGVGPNQYGLVGRKVATAPGFTYSDAMQKKGGSWGFQELSEFLTSPQKAVSGTKMAFAGLKKPEERAALIAFINKTYSDHPLPIPAAK